MNTVNSAAPAASSTPKHGVTQYSAIAESKRGEPRDVFDIARLLDEALSGASNRQTREALQMVASKHGLKVVAIDRPIAPTGVTVPKVSDRKPKPAKAGSSYKNSKEFKELSSKREAIVSSLKEMGPQDPSRQRGVSALRDVESQLKSLKPSSQGK